MPEAQQLLQITPNRELWFEGPYTDVVTCTMSLKNVTQNTVCFKVKTTAPKQYCVRPNSGWLKPGDTKQVTVMLQPLEGGIPKNPERHKFMVQSCVSPTDEVSDLEVVWKLISPQQLTYNKLLVVFADNKRTNETKLSQGVEDSYTSAQVTELTQSYDQQAASNPSALTASLRQSLKTTSEEREELRKKNLLLEKEIEELIKKNHRLQENQINSGTVEGQFPALQVILMAFATLLIGLILGKLI